MRAFVAVTNGTGSCRIRLGRGFRWSVKAPINRVVGGGHYRGYVTMPVSEAWATFGEAKGAASLAELRRLIGGDRPIMPGDEDRVLALPLMLYDGIRVLPRA